MKKTLLGMLVACLLVTACATSDKDGTAAVSGDRLNEWGDADVTNLDETRLSQMFKKTVNPVIYFDYNSYSLNGSAIDVLNAQAAWLKQYPGALIVIEGHCDERGTQEYNLALGDRRATSVRDYFLAKGIESARIRVISYGKERPQVIGSSEGAWAKNRRAVTIVN